MTRKFIQLTLTVALATFFYSCGQTSQTTEEATDSTAVEEVTAEEAEETPAPPASPRKQATGSIGDVSVTVDYGSPAVKEREVWGGLEAYGKVWRAGANETTSIVFSADVVVGGNPVAAGTYGFFIIPNEEGEWVAILNTEWSRDEHEIWGANGYEEENDVARINVAPVWAEEVQERLEYSVGEGSIDFAWEKARLSIPVEAAAAE